MWPKKRRLDADYHLKILKHHIYFKFFVDHEKLLYMLEINHEHLQENSS